VTGPSATQTRCGGNAIGRRRDPSVHEVAEHVAALKVFHAIRQGADAVTRPRDHQARHRNYL
jgi:dihydropteroate synthase